MMNNLTNRIIAFGVLLFTTLGMAQQEHTKPKQPKSIDFSQEVSHGYVDANGVKIHYAEIGQGPLVVMIHGFPDYWFT